jgi:hypothetical protein
MSVESVQALFADSRYLMAAGGFLAAVIAAFVAGYAVGRSGRPREAARAPRPPRRAPDEAEPLPEMGGEEARLMDLSAIRNAESEPPPPLDKGPRSHRR